MNPLDLFNQVKELIKTKDFEAAKTFVAENQDQLGEYFSQAQQLISGSEGLDGLVGKIKDFSKNIKAPEMIRCLFEIFFSLFREDDC